MSERGEVSCGADCRVNFTSRKASGQVVQRCPALTGGKVAEEARADRVGEDSRIGDDACDGRVPGRGIADRHQTPRKERSAHEIVAGWREPGAEPEQGSRSFSERGCVTGRARFSQLSRVWTGACGDGILTHATGEEDAKATRLAQGYEDRLEGAGGIGVPSERTR